MPKPNVTISVRKVSNATAVLDIQGEVTGFAEDVLKHRSWKPEGMD